MEGLDLGQTSNPSLAWKNGRFKNKWWWWWWYSFIPWFRLSQYCSESPSTSHRTWSRHRFVSVVSPSPPSVLWVVGWYASVPLRVSALLPAPLSLAGGLRGSARDDSHLASGKIKSIIQQQQKLKNILVSKYPKPGCHQRWKDGWVQFGVNNYFTTQNWKGPCWLLNSKKLVGSAGPLQPVRWRRLWLRSCLGHRAIAVSGPQIWNSLPVAIRQSWNNLMLVKKKLKTHLFQQPLCGSIFNIYLISI